LPEGLEAVLDRSTWGRPAIVRVIADRGRVEQAEMERTFNMGVGMVALVPPADVDRALALLLARHVPAWVAGEVTAGNGDVTLVGSHPA
jgi:phosphoribosylformylglycinamidine cyclo-ligase